MCYFCHTLRHNPSAIPHSGLKCGDPRNKYSAYRIRGLLNHKCSYCNKRTHHFWHQNNGLEDPWLRCDDHS